MPVGVLNPPRLVDLATVGRCLPAGLHGEPVAGDFLDVLPLSDDRWMITVGDVVGHGRGVGGRMAALRAETRRLAFDGLSPTEVLSRLDLFQCRLGLEELATLWFGIYDRSTDWLEYASAGHLPPVLAGADGATRLLAEASAPPLGSGVVGRHVIAERVPFNAGELLVAYSDGLVERAELDLEHQMEVLRRLVERIYEPTLNQWKIEQLVDLLLHRLMRSPAGATDDVCVLAVRCP